MTVKDTSHKQFKYIGASTDTKPIAALYNTTPGSTFYEYDTGIMYITYDGTNWVEKDTVVRLETSPSIDIGDVTLLSGTAEIGKLAAGTAAIGKVGHDISGISNGNGTVTTAGTRVALASSTTAKYVIITAKEANTGVIVVGGATVVAAASTRQGTPLNPGGSIGLPIDNLADVYLDSTVSAEGVTFTYVT